jgi:ribosome recycling factor
MAYVQNIKHIEKGIYAAKIPQVVPQRQDSRTIRVPMPKPTVEARHELYATFHKKAEEVRIQIRHAQSEGMKKGKWAKYTVEAEEVRALHYVFLGRVDLFLQFQKLMKRYVADVDKILADLKKATGSAKK